MAASHAFGAYAGAVADLRAQLRDPLEGWAAPPTLDELMAGPAPRPLPSPQQPSSSALASPKARPGAKPLSSPLAAQGTQEAVQESLTDELAELAAALKQNTLGMELRVRERGRLLDQTDTALEKSLVDVKSSHKKAKDIHRKRRLGFCATLLALIGIVAAFVGMYLFIKLTRMAGYRADRGGGPRAPPVAAWSPPPVAAHTEL
ncbi:hypothetical protein QBZ16_001157 [Prototheca wickerhamii]|uniref:Uncharacterized protein n=1 Tax=Prototheca wickerhamii TaxID=3111 RepID=A0AAD9IFJ8_PROWI|nr:hypothetical protein QBZ16_001157 [Prototheca wickerhamii]